MMLGGSICYVIGMDCLRSRPSRPIYGIDPRGHVLIRAGFFWLVCGLGMVLLQQFFPRWPHAYSGAWRHALTVGFITTMILGVGYRIIPVFIRQPLASTRLMLASAALIILGNAGRVTLELLTIGGRTWSYRLMGVTGVLELAALILFAWNLTATALNRRRISQARPAAHAKYARPGGRQRPPGHPGPAAGIRRHDVRQRPFIAPSMTFGALALAWGMDPGGLIDELRAKHPHDPDPEPRRNWQMTIAGL